jgi:hypothetical protein
VIDWNLRLTAASVNSAQVALACEVLDPHDPDWNCDEGDGSPAFVALRETYAVLAERDEDEVTP